jgi:ABC-type antimicrobial peptide transport system permease subunit
MVLRENLQVTCAGVGAGLLVALALAGLMKSLLFGLQPRDPGIFFAAAAMVVMVSLAACILPARHAASIVPVQALRIE